MVAGSCVETHRGPVGISNVSPARSEVYRSDGLGLADLTIGNAGHDEQGDGQGGNERAGEVPE